MDNRILLRTTADLKAFSAQLVAQRHAQREQSEEALALLNRQIEWNAKKLQRTRALVAEELYQVQQSAKWLHDADEHHGEKYRFAAAPAPHSALGDL
jgi:hypothetical protein